MAKPLPFNDEVVWSWVPMMGKLASVESRIRLRSSGLPWSMYPRIVVNRSKRGNREKGPW